MQTPTAHVTKSEVPRWRREYSNQRLERGATSLLVVLGVGELLTHTGACSYFRPTSPTEPVAPHVPKVRRPTRREMQFVTALPHDGLSGFPHLFRRNAFG